MRKQMKKMALLMLAVSLISLTALVGCGSGNTDAETTDTTAPTNTAPTENTPTPEWQLIANDYNDFADRYSAYADRYAANPTDPDIISKYSEYEAELKDLLDRLDKIKATMTAEEQEAYLEAIAPASEKTSAASEKIKSANNAAPEWQSFVDDYDAFADEYVAFADKYAANPTDFSLITELSGMQTKAQELQEQADELTRTLTADEAAEFAEALIPIVEKIAGATTKISSGALDMLS